MSDPFENDADEKAFYQRFQAHFEAAKPKAADCPEENRLSGFLYEVLPPDDMRRIESHVDVCASCRGRLQDLRRADEQMDTQEIPDRVSQRIRQKVDQALQARPAERGTERLRAFIASFQLWKLAAGLSAVLLIVVVYFFRADAPPPISKGAKVTDIRGQFQVTGPLGQLSTAPNVFDWERAPGAAAYIVTLYEADSATAFYEQKVVENYLHLPQEVRARILPGRVYRWQVKGLSPTGEAIPFKEGRFEIR